MRINFFEEFPVEKNLKKASLIDFPSMIYIAAKSLEQFVILETELKRINPQLTAAYWPILEKSYWVSPFSCTEELKNLFKDLEGKKRSRPLKVLIDLELPFLNKKLFFKNLFSFFKNKKLIRKIFENANRLNIKILTAEYPPPNRFLQNKLEWLGISYALEKYSHKKIVMFYSSIIKKNLVFNQELNRIKRFIVEKSQKYGQNFQVGLGTIAKGILDNEPILSSQELYEDLKFLRENKINETTIFRLGGLNQEYLRIIKKFL